MVTVTSHGRMLNHQGKDSRECAMARVVADEQRHAGRQADRETDRDRRTERQRQTDTDRQTQPDRQQIEGKQTEIWMDKKERRQ